MGIFLKDINLKGKTALITGATKGIGRGAAIAIAEAGGNIIAVGRNQIDLNTLRKEIKKFKVNYTPFNCDVNDYNGIKEFITNLKKLDILVNNAGTNRPEHFTRVKRENMNYLTDLNMKAVFNVAQLCSQKIVKNRNRKKIGGSIIHMSSQLGKVGCEGRSVYNMNKFGVEGLARGMANELAKYNIRVNTVCPTFVETPMVKRFFKNKKFKQKMLKNIPLGRVAKESDVATAVAFLASESSAMISGTSLIVDGGWTAQ